VFLRRDDFFTFRAFLKFGYARFSTDKETNETPVELGNWPSALISLLLSGTMPIVYGDYIQPILRRITHFPIQVISHGMD
jgi:hypothetical protein